MLWFNFILGLTLFHLCSKLIIIYYHSQKQRKKKILNDKIEPHHIHNRFCIKIGIVGKKIYRMGVLCIVEG